MEADREIQRRREDLQRLLRGLESLLTQTGAALGEMTPIEPSATGLAQLERLRTELAESLKQYVEQQAAFADYVREQMRKMDETRAKAAMSEKQTRPTRDQARLQQLSEELTRDLRLQRVDSAIKELLDFLSDAEFFTANASTGRRRRLRSLQKAIEKALEK